MSQLQVLVEVAVQSAGFGIVPALPLLPGRVDPGFSVPVPAAGNPALGGGPGLAIEHTCVRATIDANDVDALRASPSVVAVWSDPRIEPISGAWDCNPGIAKGSHRDVADALGASALWHQGIKGSGMVIGIVDGGVDRARYPVRDGWSPVAASPWGIASHWGGHGNMCAFDALIAAPEAGLYDLAIGKASETIPSLLSSALQAFHWALLRYREDGTPQILSNSWGLYQQSWDAFPPGNPGNYTHNPQHPLMRKAMELLDEGILMTFAAGNCGDVCGGGGRCGLDTGPGKSIRGLNGHPRIICVGAVNPRREPIGYSSQGPSTLAPDKPDVCGYSHFEGDTPSDNGTSAACPVVAGVLALMREKNPTLRQDQARHLLIETAQPIHDGGHHPSTGHGVIDARLVVAALK